MPYMKIVTDKGVMNFGSAASKALGRYPHWTEVIAVSYSVVAPRDAQSGLPTGKRQHSPLFRREVSLDTMPRFSDAYIQNIVGGRSMDGSTGRRVNEKISIRREVDSASPLLFQTLNANLLLPAVQIEFGPAEPGSILSANLLLPAVQIAFGPAAPGLGPRIGVITNVTITRIGLEVFAGRSLEAIEMSGQATFA